ncbi:MAG: T9SS type A sorting domain-containing protein [Bacteroidetes bacterium]|nr:T9SS type A sorting domain-containing protein [Bacteroidota bacterium]
MKRFVLSVFILLTVFNGHAQTMTFKGAYFSLSDTTIITMNSTGAPTFTVAGINTIIANYNVTACNHPFPSSNYQYMREIYYVQCADSNLIHDLRVNYPQYFTYFEYVYEPELLNVNKVTTTQAISIYPNPAQNNVVVNNTTGNTLSVTIRDITGKIIATEKLQQQPVQINTGNWATGTYSLSAYDDAAKLVTTQKLIKE